MLFSKTSNTNNAPTILEIISQNPEYVERFYRDRKNPFHFASRNWHSYNNPQN